MAAPKPNIVVTSNEPWGNVWFSKQHYANELAQLGYKVFFLNPPLTWSLKNLLSFGISKKQISENLVIVTYKNNFPIRLFKREFRYLNDFLCSMKLFGILKNKNLIWWQFDPFRLVHIRLLDESFRIYHVVDPYDHILTDLKLANKADLVVSISDIYKTRYSKLAKKYIQIPHGISAQEYLIDPQKLVEIESNYGRNYLLLVGTLNPDVDYHLLTMCAEEFPDRTIVVVGPLRESCIRYFKSVLTNKNVKYVGEVHAQQLKYYIKLASVCLVPYLHSRSENKHRTPLKIVNYLTQKKPILTTVNYELTELNDKAIFVAADSNDFIDKLRKILKMELMVDTQTVDKYLSGITYSYLINKILGELNG